jgi:hypothetical protein
MLGAKSAEQNGRQDKNGIEDILFSIDLVHPVIQS